MSLLPSLSSLVELMMLLIYNSSTTILVQIHQEDYSTARDHLRRIMKRHDKYTNKDELIAYAFSVAQEVDESMEPSCYSEAISCEDSSKWLVVMIEEIKSLHKNGTWNLCEPPKGK